MGSDNNQGRPSKVLRVIEAYELEGIGEELEYLWTTDDDGRLSLRELEAYFNRHVLEKALAEAGVQIIDSEIKNMYRLLTDDDASSADRRRIMGRLERQEIDVEELQSDFVSYQAIRTYLKEHRGAEYVKDTDTQSEAALESIQRLRSRVASVTESKIEQLASMDDATVGNVHVSVEVRAFCEDCNSQYDIDTLFDQRGCNCLEN
jgi:predicted transcriptional regulator